MKSSNRKFGTGCVNATSFYERKAEYFALHPEVEERKAWYAVHYEEYYKRIVFRSRVRAFSKWLVSLKLPFHLSFVRWCLVDFLRGKERRFKGIYQFIGMPGEGKTISMCAHIDRVKASDKRLVIATNFNYAGQDYAIYHWMDVINISIRCSKRHVPCLVAIDEIQNTFDASDYKNFPVAFYTLLTFNRKLQLQFLCSAQMYERIPSKIRALANYTVICKNVMHRDRWFINYYFEKDNYESQFEGKRKKAKFIRQFIADDELYSSYDTFEQIQTIKGRAEEEKGLREKAFDLLFGSNGEPET